MPGREAKRPALDAARRRERDAQLVKQNLLTGAVAGKIGRVDALRNCASMKRWLKKENRTVKSRSSPSVASPRANHFVYELSYTIGWESIFLATARSKASNAFGEALTTLMGLPPSDKKKPPRVGEAALHFDDASLKQ